METMKSDIHKNFEKFMVNDLDNFEWNEKLDFYIDPTTQLCWLTWLNCISQEQLLENDCMIDQTWFMKGSPVDV